MAFRTLKQLDCKDKHTIVRVNYDITYDATGKINDDSRLRKSIPTIEALLKSGAGKIILLSHLGRPEAGVFDAQFSLSNAAKRLEELLGESVAFVPEWDLRKVSRSHLPASRIVLLENTRFSPGEKKNDPDFAKHLASLGDCYVDDAFPAIHRADASIAGIPQHIPAAAGLLVTDELTHLAVLQHPAQPYVAYIAGGKADKLGAVGDIAQHAAKVLIGGALANTFLVAQGISVGASKYDPESVAAAKTVLDKYGDKLLLPVDLVVTAPDGSASVCRVNAIPTDAKAVDVGPQTLLAYHVAMRGAKTLLWGGPPGMFDKGYETGTRAFAQLVLECAQAGTYVIVGGGESSQAAAKYGIADKVKWNSTGGGATLEFAQGKKLPGIVALEENLRKFK